MAPQCDEIFKQKVNDCVQHIILQKFTNFHAIRSWSFQNIRNEVGCPIFLCHPVYTHVKWQMTLLTEISLFISSRGKNEKKDEFIPIL